MHAGVVLAYDASERYEVRLEAIPGGAGEHTLKIRPDNVLSLDTPATDNIVPMNEGNDEPPLSPPELRIDQAITRMSWYTPTIHVIEFVVCVCECVCVCV